MRTKPMLIALVLSLGLAASPAAAQGNLMDRGLDALRGLGGSSGGSSGGAVGSLSNSEVTAGLKEALRLATERVVGTLGTQGGFLDRTDAHIPLPQSLKTVQSALSKVGMGAMGDELEVRMNRAAEAAVPKAQDLFVQAIRSMTLDDAKGILNGSETAATDYFRSRMSEPLARDMQPIVERQLAEAGAVKTYDSMMGRYASLPLVPDVKADLTQHVLQEAVDTVFLYLGREEAAIRQDPARRTTELLKKVFGG